VAWAVRIGQYVTRAMVDMDDQTQTAFLMAMVDLGQDPFRGSLLGPKEFQRTVPLGDLGVISYTVLEDELAVEILSITWIG
jgi:hypothetical protein